jgi:choline kinase
MSNLKAIILAAGEGSRLKPLTDNKPKCLVELFGKPLINYTVELFQKYDILDITIVSGYLSNMIKIPNVFYRNNKNYASTNMVETLFCAKDKLENSVIISYADIIFQKNILEKLINSEEDISVIIDSDWEKYWKLRFENPLDDAESLILDEHNYIKNIGKKTRKISEIQGQYIGLMKFQNKGLTNLKDFYEYAKNLSIQGTNPLNPNIPFEKSYMTDLLQGLVNNGNKIKAIPVHNGWLEVDSINDYELYNKMNQNGSLSQFYNP